MAKSNGRSESRRIVPFLLILPALLITGGIALAGVPASLPAGVSSAPLSPFQGDANARSSKPSVSGPAVRRKGMPAAPAAPNVVLYDQYDNLSGQATTSQDFETELDAYDDQVADDFIVPAGQTWQVNEVDFAGQYFNGPGPAYSFNVFFYANSGALPGSPVYTATHLAYTENSGDFVVPLAIPVPLTGSGGGSHYWVSIQARLDFTPTGQFGWDDRTVLSNSPAALRNPGGGFACSGGNGWIVRTTCPSSTVPDQVFRLVGNITGMTITPAATSTATATSTSTPTLTGTPPTATPTACGSSENYAVATSTGATVVPGTAMVPGSNCDDCVVTMTLPFPFRLYDRSFTGVHAGSNGNLQFRSSDDYWANTCLPYSTFDYAILPHWDDLVPTVSGDGIYTSVSGISPNRIYNVEWRAHYYSGGGSANFEVRLYEDSATAQFDVIYGTISQGGTGATVGVQRDTGSRYTQYECNTNALSAGLKLTFTQPPCYSPTPTLTPTACTLQFNDVPPGSTFYPYVRCLACLGIINGYPDGSFKPNNNVTRGQLSKIVSNSAGFNDPQTTQMFEDVPVGSTFFQFIGRLVSRGYINGYPCGGAGEPCIPPANLPYFRPNANATRGQISKIVSNAAGFNDPPSGQQFQDVPAGSTYYTYIYRLVSRSVMSGYPCGNPEPCIPPGNLPYFRPNNNATRGQTSKIVSNTFFPDCQTPSGR